MFDNLSDKLQRVFKNLRGEGKLSAENMESALREIRMALLEADVNFRVVKQLIENIKAKAMGEEVLRAFALPAGHQDRSRGADQDPRQPRIEAALRQRAAQRFPDRRAAGLRQDHLHRQAGALAFAQRPPPHAGLGGRLPSGGARAAAHHRARIGQPIYEGAPEEKLPLDLARSARREAANNGRDVLLVDTAGRLHIDDQLMSELKQLKEQLNPVEILFVADAMTGQDAVKSADEFHKQLGITGVILTKMDGDARGGAALSIRTSPASR
jgi:signal recognition particle subunit SRP54